MDSSLDQTLSTIIDGDLSDQESSWPDESDSNIQLEDKDDGGTVGRRSDGTMSMLQSCVHLNLKEVEKSENEYETATRPTRNYQSSSSAIQCPALQGLRENKESADNLNSSKSKIFDGDSDSESDRGSNISLHLHFSASEVSVELGDCENDYETTALKLRNCQSPSQPHPDLFSAIQSPTQSLRASKVSADNLNSSKSTIFDGDSDPESDRGSDISLHLHLSASDSSDSEWEPHTKVPKTNHGLRKMPSKRMQKQSQGAHHPFILGLENMVREKCCLDNCVSYLTDEDFAKCYEQMRSRNEPAQKQFILSEISKHTNMEQSKCKPVVKHRFVISGNFVCARAWCIAHCVSDWRFKECLKLFKAGKVTVMHKNTGRRRKTRKAAIALAWMTNLFKRQGDYMPHKPKVHLPHTWTKKAVFERMILELKQSHYSPEGSISYEHFIRLWAKELPEFVIPKSTDFSKCTTCTQLQEAYENAPSQAQRKQIADLKATHDRLVETERRAYHNARDKARRDHGEMTCVIIDGMDQSKTDIPHLIVKDKDCSSQAKLQVHFTGVLVHTGTPEGKLPFVFHDLKHIPHDGNLTIHCLTEALTSAGGYLGKVLFLQMDNCYRENKNKFVLSYAALLVERDIFEEVYVHFLPVGHTHEDVDQMFSCVARHLQHTNIYTLSDLESETSQSFTPRTDVRTVTHVQDVKAVLNKHLYGQFGNHSKPHWFRFRKTNGRCYMHYKKWEGDLWQPETFQEYPHGLLCLRHVPEVDQVLPWVVPSLDKIDLPKLIKELPGSYSHRLPASAEEWWQVFLQQIPSTYEALPDVQEWNLLKLERVQASSNNMVHEAVRNIEIEKIQLRIEEECPEVRIGDQGRSHKCIREMADYITVEDGTLVAVHLDERKGRPFIGKVLKKVGDNVEVQWMRGSYTGPWQLWVEGVGRNSKPYCSSLPMSSLILWDFKLTNKKRLQKTSVDMLKAKYEELDIEKQTM